MKLELSQWSSETRTPKWGWGFSIGSPPQTLDPIYKVSNAVLLCEGLHRGDLVCGKAGLEEE